MTGERIPTHSNQETSMLSLPYRLGLATVACMQNGVFGGILYGWATIDRTLLAAPLEQGGAALTVQETTTIYSWACIVTMWASLLLGIVLDVYGPRACSIMGHVSIIVGCIVFALGSSMPSFAVGMALIAFGGPAFHLSIAHLSNLFPRHKFFALNFMLGMVCFSSLVLVAFDWLWATNGSLTFRTLFCGLALLTLVSLAASVYFCQDKPFGKENTQNLTTANEENQRNSNTRVEKHVSATLFERCCSSLSDRSLSNVDEPQTVREQMKDLVAQHCQYRLPEQPLDSQLHLNIPNASEIDQSSFDRPLPQSAWEHHLSYQASQYALETGDSAFVSRTDLPFLQQLTSGTHIGILLVFGSCCFVANFFIVSFSTELADLHDFSVQQQHRLVEMMTIIMAGSFGMALACGWLTDQLGLDCCTVVSLLLCQLHVCMLWLFHNRWFGLIFSFVCFATFRQFFFGIYFAALIDKLGLKYFGLLSGIGFALSGTMEAWMVPLASAVEGDCHLEYDNLQNETELMVSLSEPINCNSGHWMALHKSEMILFAFLILVPIAEYYLSCRRDEQVRVWIRKVQQHDRKYAESADGTSSCPARSSATSTSASLYGSV